MKLGQGNSLAYTLRRLARKRPVLLAAYERGELSANAAAIEAGFRRKKPTKEELKMTTKLLPAAIIAAIAATLGFVGHD